MYKAFYKGGGGVMLVSWRNIYSFSVPAYPLSGRGSLLEFIPAGKEQEVGHTLDRSQG